jgi:hypothetical protein
MDGRKEANGSIILILRFGITTKNVANQNGPCISQRPCWH